MFTLDKTNSTSTKVVKFNSVKNGLVSQYEIEYLVRNKTVEFIYSEKQNENTSRRGKLKKTIKS